jgi:hypothetical protein
MVSPTDGWAVGGVFIGPPNWLSGYIYRWNGGDWTRVDSTIQYQYLNTVAMLDSNTGWVAGDQWNTAGQYFENTILQWSGSVFSEVYNIDTVPSGLFNDIDAITASDVWAVGDHSNISHWDGLIGVRLLAQPQTIFQR